MLTLFNFLFMIIKKLFKECIMSNLSIGVFDSGSGGLSTCQALIKKFPSENIIYFGDLLYMPYGEKSNEFLVKRIKQILKLFATLNCKLIVIACNTASTVILNNPELRESVDIPVVDVVTSNVNFLTQNVPEDANLTILSTQATFNSETYPKLLKEHFSNIFPMPMPNWASNIEEYGYKSPEISKIIAKDIENIPKLPSHYVFLACTHYYFLMPLLKKLMPKTKFIDSSTLVINDIKKILTENNMAVLNNPNPLYTIMTSDFQSTFTSLAQMTFGHSKIELIFNDKI